tara:strand:- start:17 stop:517 length:501 start_codon:yes stop_codon:yes gene_type:complete
MHWEELTKEEDYQVEKLGIEDLNSCLELDKLTLNNFWSKNLWEKELKNSESINIGIKEGSNLKAMACILPVLNEYSLTLIAVHPSQRKKGLGTLILAQICKQAHKNGLSKIILEVDEENSAAIGLYNKIGFKTVRIRKKYYRNGNNALVKILDLGVFFESQPNQFK